MLILQFFMSLELSGIFHICLVFPSFDGGFPVWRCGILFVSVAAISDFELKEISCFNAIPVFSCNSYVVILILIFDEKSCCDVVKQT